MTLDQLFGAETSLCWTLGPGHLALTQHLVP